MNKLLLLLVNLSTAFAFDISSDLRAGVQTSRPIIGFSKRASQGILRKRKEETPKEPPKKLPITDPGKLGGSNGEEKYSSAKNNRLSPGDGQIGYRSTSADKLRSGGSSGSQMRDYKHTTDPQARDQNQNKGRITELEKQVSEMTQRVQRDEAALAKLRNQRKSGEGSQSSSTELQDMEKRLADLMRRLKAEEAALARARRGGGGGGYGDNGGGGYEGSSGWANGGSGGGGYGRGGVGYGLGGSSGRGNGGNGVGGNTGGYRYSQLQGQTRTVENTSNYGTSGNFGNNDPKKPLTSERVNVYNDNRKFSSSERTNSNNDPKKLPSLERPNGNSDPKKLPSLERPNGRNENNKPPSLEKPNGNNDPKKLPSSDKPNVNNDTKKPPTPDKSNINNTNKPDKPPNGTPSKVPAPKDTPPIKPTSNKAEPVTPGAPKPAVSPPKPGGVPRS